LDDSRAVVSGALFVAVRGELADGLDYLGAAAAAGAAAVCIDREPAPETARELLRRGVPKLVVPDALEAFHRLAADIAARSVTDP